MLDYTFILTLVLHSLCLPYQLGVFYCQTVTYLVFFTKDINNSYKMFLGENYINTYRLDLFIVCLCLNEFSKVYHKTPSHSPFPTVSEDENGGEAPDTPLMPSEDEA